MAEESTRRLPSWMMLGVTADADKNKKNKTTDVAELIEEEKPTSTRNSFSLTQCKTVRRKRNQVQQDADSIPISNKNIGRKVGKRFRFRKAKNVALKRSEEIHTPSPIDDDDDHDHIDLTVEDLVSIAEEYVKANVNLNQKGSLDRECESQRELPLMASTRNDLKGSRFDPDNEGRSLPDEATASNVSTISLTNEQSFSGASTTGDPAQDMLDLFLGPLLKKPLEEVKKTEFISKNIDYAYEVKRQSQSDLGKEIVPPMAMIKKKSSLRDKVYKLLD